MDTASQFADLFRGRTNAYGTEAGGCDKIDPPLRPNTYESIYQYRVVRHLDGTAPMGVYPMTDDLECWWGCTDLDYTQDPTEALNLATMLRAAGVNAWVEVSRSKGFHVWTFASEPVPAETMRNAMLAVHQMLEIPAKEVNPKQVQLTERGLKYGNYVRLPYPGAIETGTTTNSRQMVYDPHAGWLMPLGAFAQQAYQSRSPLGAYVKLAALYDAPPPPKRVDIDTEPEVDGMIIAKMSKPGYLALRYGPREGNDRSSSLMRLAHICHEDGLTPAECLAVVRQADLRWGKFSLRADCEDQLHRMVTHAYQ